MSQQLCVLKLLLSLYTSSPEQFYDEQEKILWVLTFFKDGHAAKWSENVFHQDTDTGIFPMQTWGSLNSNSRFTSSL